MTNFWPWWNRKASNTTTKIYCHWVDRLRRSINDDYGINQYSMMMAVWYRCWVRNSWNSSGFRGSCSLGLIRLKHLAGLTSSLATTWWATQAGNSSNISRHSPKQSLYCSCLSDRVWLVTLLLPLLLFMRLQLTQLLRLRLRLLLLLFLLLLVTITSNITPILIPFTNNNHQ